ncbi:uncharacterized protein LOC109852997 isoform X2 [Pseudomyrmex gracilis]|nr:uncharacterized protein LOC109852997 isoform X2 [Pseudomyrmex gracilis]XP_020280275.1 uncharacterized protein LOC109852997 isoform X2 [Pseudomyrmex gracilis]
MESNLMLTCPYNKSHRIARSKFMQHVTKCKKTVDTEDFVECPLETSHIVESDKLKEHIASCSQLGELVRDTDPSEKELKLPTLVGNIESEENWDEEPETPSYNPAKVSAEKKIVRSMPGLSKSKRFAFRQVERQRLANIEREEGSSRELGSFETKHKIHEAPHVRLPRSTSAVISETAKKIANTPQVALNTKADLSENSFCTNSSVRLCDSSVQTMDSSFKDNESVYSSDLHNEFSIEHNIENANMEKCQNDMIFEKSSRFQESCARDSVIDKEEENLSMFDQNKTLQIDVGESEKILEAFRNNDSVASTVSNEPLEKNKLLCLLKNAEHLKELNQSVENETVTDLEKTVKNSGEMELEWDEIVHKVKRLAYLTDIQNTAATESAQLLLQLKNLKLRQDAKK